jgi:two-component system, cell cycle sensor histidine kinase and response regulator CckA
MDVMDQDSPPRWLIGVVAGVFLLFTIGGSFFYLQQRNRIRSQVEDQLFTIARMKANQIVAWRAERLHNATVLAGDPFFVEAAYSWIQHPDPKNSEKILRHFRTIQKEYSYWNILLTGRDGKNLLILEGPSGTALGATAAGFLAEALRSKRAVMTDLIPGEGVLPVRLDTIAPLVLKSPAGEVPFGALVLVSNVQDYLYPVIQAWPVPSTSAESLLVRRDGDSVLFLNEVRHQKRAALNLRVPLTQMNVPAVMAGLGKQGIVEGLDYRGVKVFAALQPVAGTGWRLVAKMDESEALAAWRFRSLLIIGMGISLFVATSSIIWAVWQRRMKAGYRRHLATERARQETERRYGTTLMCIGDGVIVANPNGEITLMNPVAEGLTGWKQIEAQGKSIETVFDICNENTRKKVENPIRKVVECGRTVGLANHTLLISKSGIEYPIMDSSAPVHDTNGVLIGIVLVFRDQTAERQSQKLLQTEHDNLRAVLRASPVGLLVFDESARVTSASPEAERLFNKSLQLGEHPPCGEFIGCLNHINRAEGCGKTERCGTCLLHHSIHEALQAGKGIQSQDCILERQVDGQTEIVFLSIGVEPVELDGRPHAVVALQDISQRRQVEIQLQKSNDLLNEVGETAKIGGWMLDPANMIGIWTRTMYDIFEIPEGQKPGIEDAMLYYHPEDRAKISAAISEAIEKGNAYDLELRFITAKGRHLWVRSQCKTVVENGKLVRLVGALQDITIPKQAGLDLKEKTEEIERYFSTALDLFCIADVGGQFKRLNREWANLLGYPLDELEGCSLLKVVHPDDQEATTQVLSNLIQQKAALSFVNRCIHSDGSWRWLEWRAFLSGDLIYAAARNITDRVLAEQQSEKLAQQLQQAMKMEAVGRLAGGVAHDFNNLLTGIGGYTDLIISSLNPGDPALPDLIEIRKATDSAAALTRQLLAFSRKQLIEPKVLNLNHLIADLQKMLLRLIGEDIELKTTLQPGLGAVLVDPGQFEQMLVNLAVNARDAMQDGGKMTIETANIQFDNEYCSAHTEAKPGRHVMLAVSDTGCGMSDEVKAHIFEPFFTTKQKGRGTGLGLATIYGIVKQSGGSIEVYSEPGKGTVFKIYLPVVAEAAQPLDIEKPKDSSIPKGDETILLVEDEKIVRDLAVRMLKLLNYNVLSASNGAEALEVVQNYEDVIDLLITDVVMPGMNGRELAERLQLKRPEIKVLFSSGYTENAIAHHGILDRNLSFIGKPYSSRDLAKKIRELLG